MRVLDPGHSYALDALEPAGGRAFGQILRFVKRVGEGYPGNEEPPHPGVQTQEVLRALIDRTKYVREQSRQLGDEDSVLDNEDLIEKLREALWILEERAARRHKRPWPVLGIRDGEIEHAPTCQRCGHVGCEGACEREYGDDYTETYDTDDTGASD